jgi:4-amino-4-deoxy-L-arabinose transferase-like glycosyltransferase
MREALLIRWRSPHGHPSWTRPALGLTTAAAGVLYGWNAAGNLEVYYAAAVRSMSVSWHNFFFAALDPAGSVSVDKLPGAFWLQALSVRLFGIHGWALVAPQVLEGVASVLVIYHAVSRLAGALAGIAAAIVLALSPATVALNRGNIPDTLMILLLLLAVDSTVTTVVRGRARSLILTGGYVGLAFQAKMIEAWLVLPAIALLYAIAGPGRGVRRLLQLAGLAVITVVVSLSWMAVVSLWPAGGRPYVDGSGDNSLFSQVFVYNGFGRLDEPSPDQLLSRAIGLPSSSVPSGWSRLLSGAYGHDTGWLLPAALLALLACLLVGARARDRLEVAGAVLWGGWLLVLFVSFSASSTINAYYTGALSPPVAALLGTGLALAWRERARTATRVTMGAVVAASCAYADWLLPARGAGLVGGLPEGVAALGLVAVAALALFPRFVPPAGAYALAGLAVLVVPAAASISLAAKAFGPFDTPFEAPSPAAYARALGALPAQTALLLPGLERTNSGQADLMATQTAAVAAPFIYDSGEEVVPIGGFTGTIPEPTLARLKAMVAAGDFHLVIQAPQVSDPRLLWVEDNCLAIRRGGGRQSPTGLRFAVYYCGRLPSLLPGTGPGGA